jgi:hypothetical protein
MHNLACSYVISAVHNIRGKRPVMSTYSVLLCPAASVSTHELVQITGQLANCRSVHGFKSSFAFVPVPLDVLGAYAGIWVDKV